MQFLSIANSMLKEPQLQAHHYSVVPLGNVAWHNFHFMLFQAWDFRILSLSISVGDRFVKLKVNEILKFVKSNFWKFIFCSLIDFYQVQDPGWSAGLKMWLLYFLCTRSGSSEKLRRPPMTVSTSIVRYVPISEICHKKYDRRNMQRGKRTNPNGQLWWPLKNQFS